MLTIKHFGKITCPTAVTRIPALFGLFYQARSKYKEGPLPKCSYLRKLIMILVQVIFMVKAELLICQ